MFRPPSSLPDESVWPYPGLELLATAVLLLGEDLVVRYANPAAENLFELSRRQLVGRGAPGRPAPSPQAAPPPAAPADTEHELELGVNGKPRLHLSCTVSVIESDA